MKKKDKRPVVLSNQELIPSVLGVMDEKGKSIFPILLFFGFLVGFIIGLPTITSYLKGEQQIPFVGGGTSSKNPNPPSNPSLEEEKFYDYKSNLDIVVDGISFRNFNVNQNSLSITLMNQSASNTYLSNHYLYLELYDSNLTLLQRIKMPVIQDFTKGESKVFTFDLNTSTSISKLKLEEKERSSYPAVNLNKESDGTYSLTCRKDHDKLEYMFDETSKLYFITHTVNYTSVVSNYTEIMADYQQLSNKYNGIDGVVSNFLPTLSSFTLTSTFALEKIDFNNRTIKNTLDHEAYYGKDTEGKVVYFELSAMNYQCS